MPPEYILIQTDLLAPHLRLTVSLMLTRGSLREWRRLLVLSRS